MVGFCCLFVRNFFVVFVRSSKKFSQEKMNRIFQPYFTTKEKGTGLGLMIVQRIIREHGGRIELESNTGEGTMFRLWFPLTEQQPLRLTGGQEINSDA